MATDDQMSVEPAPTAEETAAIMAAVELAWPRPVAGAHTGRDASLAWRFSGRWWQRDRFARVDRPWN